MEVLYLFDPIDDFVMTSLGEYEGKKLVSSDSADIDLPPLDEDEKPKEPVLSSEELKNFTSKFFLPKTRITLKSMLVQQLNYLDSLANASNDNPNNPNISNDILRAIDRITYLQKLITDHQKRTQQRRNERKKLMGK